MSSSGAVLLFLAALGIIGWGISPKKSDNLLKAQFKPLQHHLWIVVNLKGWEGGCLISHSSSWCNLHPP